MARKRKVPKGGDCYEVAAKLLMDWNIDGTLRKAKAEGRQIVLVHAEVYHELSDWHGHAWVEVEEPLPNLPPEMLKHVSPESFRMRTVHDHSNGHNATLPQPIYYWAGHVRDPRYYTWEEASALMLKSGHYGPWE
jgi:hypothetical protein